MVETSRVSDLDFFGAPVRPQAETGPPIRKAPARRHRTLLLAGLVVVALLCAGFMVLSSEPRDDRPVMLPDTLAGQPMAEQQFAEWPGWRTSMEELFGDHPFDGRAFGNPQSGVVMNLVVIRADSRDEVDAGLGRPPYTQIGEVSCTHTFQLDGEFSPAGQAPEPYVSDSMLLCWRARDTLTVSVLVLIGSQGYEQTAAQAVNEAWALQQ